MIQPRFSPEITLGNVLQVIVIVAGIGGAYGAAQSRLSGFETRLNVMEVAIAERRSEEREFATEMRGALADIQRSLTDIRVQAARVARGR